MNSGPEKSVFLAYMHKNSDFILAFKYKFGLISGLGFINLDKQICIGKIKSGQILAILTIWPEFCFGQKFRVCW